MSVALAFLILIALTNYVIIFFSCLGLRNYGAWLSKYHKVDLWLHRVVVSTFTCYLPATSLNSILLSFSFGRYPAHVSASKSFLLSLLQIQNGVAIYATWTTIASLVNLTIVLDHDGNTSQTDAATVSLSVLTVMLSGW